MADEGRAFALREEDRAELVSALKKMLRITDRLDAQLSTMASQLSTMASTAAQIHTQSLHRLDRNTKRLVTSLPFVISSTSPPPVLPVTPIDSHRHPYQPEISSTVCSIPPPVPQTIAPASPSSSTSSPYSAPNFITEVLRTSITEPSPPLTRIENPHPHASPDFRFEKPPPQFFTQNGFNVEALWASQNVHDGSLAKLSTDDWVQTDAKLEHKQIEAHVLLSVPLLHPVNNLEMQILPVPSSTNSANLNPKSLETSNQDVFLEAVVLAQLVENGASIVSLARVPQTSSLDNDDIEGTDRGEEKYGTVFLDPEPQAVDVWPKKQQPFDGNGQELSPLDDIDLVNGSGDLWNADQKTERSAVYDFLYPSRELLPDDKEMSIFDHLVELRQRAFVSISAVGAMILGCFAFSKELIMLSESPVKEQGYYEWKQAGGIGVWRYGGTVKITPFHKEESSSSSICSENAYESPDDYESLQYEQLSEFLYLSMTVADEESKAAKALSLLFDRFGLHILQAYLTERNGIADFPLNAMVIDTVIRKVVKDFSSLLVSQGIQLGLILKNILENMSLSKEDFLEAISQYLSQQTASACGDSLEFCFDSGKRETIQPLLWDLGLKIAIGAARDFAFLHTLDGRVTDRDIKTSNTLLGGTYSAEISDFGLAKLGPSASPSSVSMRVMNTEGYAALEYVSTGHLYVKSDVYSFSVVLVESRGNEWSFDKCRQQWDPGKYCVALDPDTLEFYLCV